MRILMRPDRFGATVFVVKDEAGAWKGKALHYQDVCGSVPTMERTGTAERAAEWMRSRGWRVTKLA